jgi:hypothetical protein
MVTRQAKRKDGKEKSKTLYMKRIQKNLKEKKGPDRDS